MRTPVLPHRNGGTRIYCAIPAGHGPRLTITEGRCDDCLEHAHELLDELILSTPGQGSLHVTCSCCARWVEVEW